MQGLHADADHGALARALQRNDGLGGEGRRRLEEENAKLKRLVAQLAMEVDSLKAALGERW